MKLMGKIACVGLVVGLLAGAASADIVTYFDPADETLNLNQSVTVDLRATIPADEPLLGWGLDVVQLDETVVSLESVTIGPAFMQLPDGDGDGLIANTGFPPAGVTGDLLLATLTLKGIAIGETDIIADYTPDDGTEGLYLDPTGMGTLAAQTGHITVVPEPAALMLLLVAGLIRRR